MTQWWQKILITLHFYQKMQDFSQKVVPRTNDFVFTYFFLLFALEQHKKAENQKVKSDIISHKTKLDRKKLLIPLKIVRNNWISMMWCSFNNMLTIYKSVWIEKSFLMEKGQCLGQCVQQWVWSAKNGFKNQNCGNMWTISRLQVHHQRL